MPVLDKGRETMRKLAYLVACAYLAGCAGSPPPQPVSREADPIYQQIKSIVEAQGECFKREAVKVAPKKVDLDTAAYSVVASCVAETQKLKAFQSSHDLRSVPQMQAYWAQQDQADLQHAKQMVALLRTN
jgi:hypothetical protein